MRSSFSVGWDRLRIVAADDERSPIRKVVVVMQHGKLRLSQSLRSRQMVDEQLPIKVLHQGSGGIIVHTPECGNHLLRTRVEKSLRERGQFFPRDILALRRTAAQGYEARHVEGGDIGQPEHAGSHARTTCSRRQCDARELRMTSDQDRMSSDMQDIQRCVDLCAHVVNGRLLATQFMEGTSRDELCNVLGFASGTGNGR